MSERKKILHVRNKFEGDLIKILPYDSEVEYIESTTNKQWLNTGLKSYNQNTPANLKYARYDGFVAPMQSTGYILHGHNGWGFWGFQDGKWMKSNGGTSTLPIEVGKFVKIKCTFSSISSEVGLWIDDVLVSSQSSYYGNANTYGIGLFCLGNWDGTVTGAYWGKWRMGTMRVESKGEVRDFIPVRVGNIGAMFDIANPFGGPNRNGLYFSNGGTNFGIGPDKPRI